VLEDPRWTPYSSFDVGPSGLFKAVVSSRSLTRGLYWVKLELGSSLLMVRGFSVSARDNIAVQRSFTFDRLEGVADALKQTLDQSIKNARAGEILDAIQEADVSPLLTDRRFRELCTWEWEHYNRLPERYLLATQVFGTSCSRELLEEV